MRTVDTKSYLDMMKGLLQEGKDVPVLISGNSMSPFLIHQRDTILLSPVKRPLKKGDMALYQRKTGQYVMHRICRVRKKEGRAEFYFIGDAQMDIEGPIGRGQIAGVVTAVQRKGKWLKPGSFWWEFFRLVWPRVIPMRKTIQKAYSSLVPKKK